MITVLNIPCKSLPGKQGVQNIPSMMKPQDASIFLAVLGSVSQVAVPKIGEELTADLSKITQSFLQDIESEPIPQTKKEEADKQESSPLQTLLILPGQIILPQTTPPEIKNGTVSFMGTSVVQAASFIPDPAVEPPVAEGMPEKSFENVNEDKTEVETNMPKAPKDAEPDLPKDIVLKEADSLEIFKKPEVEMQEPLMPDETIPPVGEGFTKKNSVERSQKTDQRLPNDPFPILMPKEDNAKNTQVQKGQANTNQPNADKTNNGMKEQIVLSHEAPTGKQAEKKDGILDQAAGFMLGKTGVVIDRVQTPEVNPQIINEPVYLQVCNKISGHIKENGIESIKMKLYPEGLGEIQVTLTCKDQTVSLDILTDNEITQKILESQSGELKAALSTKNYEVSGLSVNARSEFFGASNNGFSFLERNNTGNGQGQNERQPFHTIADERISGEESPIYTKWQDISSGRLNFWA